MAFKFVTFAVLIAVANAGLLPAAPAAVTYHQPATLVQQRVYQPAPVLQQIATPVLAKHDDEYDPNPQYSYSYDIHDSLTGDAKNQQETRSGDVVQGQYSLIDADGYRRTVDYTADPIHGFNAVVNREPLTKAVAVAPVAAKVIAPAAVAYHQPAAVAYHQPAAVAYHQPAVAVAKTILPAQPVAYAAQPVAYAQPAAVAYHQPAAVAYAQPQYLQAPLVTKTLVHH